MCNNSSVHVLVEGTLNSITLKFIPQEDWLYTIHLTFIHVIFFSLEGGDGDFYIKCSILRNCPHYLLNQCVGFANPGLQRGPLARSSICFWSVF